MLSLWLWRSRRMQMKILTVSDIELEFIYSHQLARRFQDVDLIIGCGDLPYYYLEFMISMLDVPLYFVRGNHASQSEYGVGGVRRCPWGAVDLHRRTVRDESGLLLAGIEGCNRYNFGEHQYTQEEMWSFALLMAPALLANRIRYGRYLDIFISHAPPWKIHDNEDLPHQGIKAFNWLIRVFKPLYHIHGHIHVYRSDTEIETQVGKTRVINSYGYHELVLRPEELLARSISPRQKILREQHHEH
jgi:Icc-related predicted phosphoesterase